MIIRTGEEPEDGAVAGEAEATSIPAAIGPRLVDIPYPFARKFGVVIAGVSDTGRLNVAVREGSDPRVLIEIRRHLAQSFEVQFVDPGEFDRLLSQHYAMDGSAAEMAGSLDVGADELDLLAGNLPTAEDLLDRSEEHTSELQSH